MTNRKPWSGRKKTDKSQVKPKKHRSESGSASKFLHILLQNNPKANSKRPTIQKTLETERIDEIMEAHRIPSSLYPNKPPLTFALLRTHQEAKEQEAIIHERLKRAKKLIPPYEFQNYIGKGSFGRVYAA